MSREIVAFKGSFVTKTLSAIVITCGLAAIHTAPAAAQSASSLDCKDCVKSKHIKDGKINFDGPEGLAALETMKKLFRGCNMLNLPVGDAGKPFNAGEVVMHFWSTSAVGAIERSGDRHRILIDGRSVFDGREASLKGGGVGLFSWKMKDVRFDNLIVLPKVIR